MKILCSDLDRGMVIPAMVLLWENRMVADGVVCCFFDHWVPEKLGRVTANSWNMWSGRGDLKGLRGISVKSANVQLRGWKWCILYHPGDPNGHFGKGNGDCIQLGELGVPWYPMFGQTRQSIQYLQVDMMINSCVHTNPVNNTIWKSLHPMNNDIRHLDHLAHIFTLGDGFKYVKMSK
jgi:hypothetical protein